MVSHGETKTLNFMRKRVVVERNGINFGSCMQFFNIYGYLGLIASNAIWGHLVTCDFSENTISKTSSTN